MENDPAKENVGAKSVNMWSTAGSPFFIVKWCRHKHGSTPIKVILITIGLTNIYLDDFLGKKSLYRTWITEIDFRNHRQNKRNYVLILLLDSLFCLAIVSQSHVAASVFLHVKDRHGQTRPLAFSSCVSATAAKNKDYRGHWRHIRRYTQIHFRFRCAFKCQKLSLYCEIYNFSIGVEVWTQTSRYKSVWDHLV